MDAKSFPNIDLEETNLKTITDVSLNKREHKV